MKKFYKLTNGLDFRQIPSVTGHNSSLFNLNGNEIYYFDSDITDQMQINPLTIFGDEEFNMFQDPIGIEDVISCSPESPVDTGWYLVSLTESLYDNLTTIAIGTSISGMNTDDSVVTNGTAAGIIVSQSGTSPQILVIKYNGNSFEEGDLLQQDTAFHSGSASQTITVGSSVIIGDFNSFEGCMAYYESADTVNAWKYLRPFNGLLINYNGTEYMYKTIEFTDARWKKT